jgi:glycosyltransferase involved in cell wall biosynthesis
MPRAHNNDDRQESRTGQPAIGATSCAQAFERSACSVVPATAAGTLASVESEGMLTSMRMLIDASFFTDVKVGIARYISQLALHLSPLCDVTVLTSRPDAFETIGCRILAIPRWTATHRGRVLWELTALANRCIGSFDVLLCTTPMAPPLVRLPKVATLHDITPLAISNGHSTRNKVLFWLSLQTLRSADAVVVDSQHTRHDLMDLNLVSPWRIHVVPVGPGIRPVGADNQFGRQFAPYLLYVGGHIPNKNVPRLLAAFARIRAADQPRLVMVGYGSPRDLGRTSTSIAKLALARRTVMLSNLDDDSLSSLYRGCRAFVFPSLYEGFGLPVLEAMAHGAPVACSRCSSLPEVGGQAVLYFDPTSVDDITAKLQTILGDEQLRSELSQRGLARASCFSWENAARGVLDAAHAAISRRHSAPRELPG